MTIDGFLPSHYAHQIFISCLWKLNSHRDFALSLKISMWGGTLFFFLIPYNLSFHIWFIYIGVYYYRRYFFFSFEGYLRKTHVNVRFIFLLTHRSHVLCHFINWIMCMLTSFLNEKNKNSNSVLLINVFQSDLY